MWRRITRFAPLVGVVALTACGGGASKPASDASQAKTDEDVPKWDSSSETADQASHPKPSPPPPDTAAPDGASPFSVGAASTGAAMPVSPPQQQRRGDQYDREATESVLRRAARQAKENCGSAKDEDGKAKGPWGKTTVSVALGHNGHSRGVTIGPPYDGKPTGRCVLQAFANLTFPPWSGPDTQVTWEVELVQPK